MLTNRDRICSIECGDNCDKVIIDSAYEVCNFLGKGSFGQLRIGKCVTTHEPVAIKLELEKNDSEFHSEFRFYQILGQREGIPKILYAGTHMSHHVMVMELLGLSLEDLFDLCSRKFTVRTICMIALKILDLIEYIHGKKLVHRDLKPQNVLIGRPLKQQHVLHIIDYGLSKEYAHLTTGDHIPFGRTSAIVGTPAYLSINGHKGERQSRRDDLESLAYVLIYFAKGTLPWCGLHAATRRDLLTEIGEIKIKTKTNILCSGLPEEFGSFLDYARNLDYFDKPDYFFMRKLWKDMMAKLGIFFDNHFDWTMKLIQIASLSCEDSDLEWSTRLKFGGRSPSPAMSGCGSPFPYPSPSPAPYSSYISEYPSASGSDMSDIESEREKLPKKMEKMFQRKLTRQSVLSYSSDESDTNTAFQHRRRSKTMSRPPCLETLESVNEQI